MLSELSFPVQQGRKAYDGISRINTTNMQSRCYILEQCLPTLNLSIEQHQSLFSNWQPEWVFIIMGWIGGLFLDNWMEKWFIIIVIWRDSKGFKVSGPSLKDPVAENYTCLLLWMWLVRLGWVPHLFCSKRNMYVARMAALSATTSQQCQILYLWTSIQTLQGL